MTLLSVKNVTGIGSVSRGSDDTTSRTSRIRFMATAISACLHTASSMTTCKRIRVARSMFKATVRTTTSKLKRSPSLFFEINGNREVFNYAV